MKHLFIRCNGGHYYRSTVACPWDGWSCDGLDRALTIFRELGEDANITRLRDCGVREEILARFIHRGEDMEANAAHSSLF